jgi:hypothetical protein
MTEDALPRRHVMRDYEAIIQRWEKLGADFQDRIAELERAIALAVSEVSAIASELEPSWTQPPANKYEGKYEAEIAERLRRIAATLDAAKGSPPAPAE